LVAGEVSAQRAPFWDGKVEERSVRAPALKGVTYVI
jgi:hypothetical protein